MSDNNFPEDEKPKNAESSKELNELSDQELDNIAGGDGATPAATGHVQTHDIHFTKLVDKSSPNLT